MITLNKKLVAATATLIALSGTAFADAHTAFDADTARLDLSLDTDGDGTVSDDEIIAGNMAVFDTNGDGAIDAAERGVAEEMLMGGSMIESNSGAMEMNTDSAINFDANTARLDLTLDTDGDGEVSDDELIEGNMATFDTDGNGAIDADERGVAEETLMTGATASAGNSMTTDPAMAVDFNADTARLNLSYDTNGDGEVSDDELIEANMELFDTDGNGSIDADERGVAEQMLMQ